MSRDDTDRDRSACVTDVAQIACSDGTASGPALSRTAQAIALVEQGYSQTDAARMVGITKGAVHLGLLKLAGRAPSRKPKGAKFRAPPVALAVEIGDPSVCTDERCSIIELHRAGPYCTTKSGVRRGAGKRK